jgi:hypothetical protein
VRFAFGGYDVPPPPPPPLDEIARKSFFNKNKRNCFSVHICE